MNELHLSPKDFVLEWFSGSGAGGQHRNKHQNCARITHHATGLSATGQNSRSRVTNQAAAFKTLAQKILATHESGKIRGGSDVVVRTYHFERDIATDWTTERKLSRVMNGEIDDFIVAALQGQRKERRTGRV
jgi:protein subunit release factor A